MEKLEQICKKENPTTKETQRPYQQPKTDYEKKPYEREQKDYAEFFDMVNSLQELGWVFIFLISTLMDNDYSSQFHPNAL